MTRVVVVAHHARRQQAEALAESLEAQLLMDEEGRGAWWNHRRALRWAADQDERVVIMEDDALPVPVFRERAAAVLARWPEELVSFYLGTGRPPQYQARIQGLLADCDDHIVLDTLIHGVCYSVPPGGLHRLLAEPTGYQVDLSIGGVWGRPVVYTVPSLVDHADGPPVERHFDRQPRTEPRRAWRLPPG